MLLAQHVFLASFWVPKYAAAMKILILILFTLSFAVTALGANSDRRIMTGAVRAKVVAPCSRPAPAKYTRFWNPSEKQIDELESRFDSSVQQPILHPLADYFRQYVGIQRGKTKLIYLNALAKSKHGSPVDLGTPLIICDGGSSSFGVEYSFETKCFQNFSFDGRFTSESSLPAKFKCP